ncbi:putative E3 ubiquitin ligase [Tubulinosema ratisbonensis]|uniref:Putative E3 ubiquitin ligase n=1 Tax=Tubulinosema ratisbonensis TaxID=291195 RepID=A0A437AHB3_9MICR|nr:putative E3 ubiquitin ligase [Tubulinosema ratisbonensis]
MEHLEQFLLSTLKTSNFTILEVNPVSDPNILENNIPCFINEDSNLVDIVPKLKDTTIHSGYFCYFDPGKVCLASESFALSVNTPSDFDSFVVCDYEREKSDKMVSKMKKVIDFETQTVCSEFTKINTNSEKFNNFQAKQNSSEKSVTITFTSPQTKKENTETNTIKIKKFNKPVEDPEKNITLEKINQNEKINSQDDVFYEDGININSINLKKVSFVIKDPKRIKKICYVKFEYDPKSVDFFDKLCENCLKNHSICYCFAERAVLCQECDKLIHNNKLTMRHRREYKEKECLEYTTCQIHQIPTEYFCHSHSQSFCIYCKSNHINCSFSDYKVSLELIKNSFSENISQKILKLQNKNHFLEELIKNYNKKVKEIKYEISKEYLGIINKINLLNSLNEKSVIGEYLLNNNLLNLFTNLKEVKGNWVGLSEYFNKINVQERELPRVIEIKKEGNIKINKEDERKIERVQRNYGL